MMYSQSQPFIEIAPQLFLSPGAGTWLLLELLLSILCLAEPIRRIWQRSAPLTLLRWLSIPYLALISGDISSRWMGVEGVQWENSFGFGVIVLGLLLAAWFSVHLAASTSLRASDAEAASAVLHPQTDRGAKTERERRHWVRVQSALLDGAKEFNWSFWRAGWLSVLLLAGGQPATSFYWACWIAAICALPGLLTNTANALNWLISLALLFSTTVLFFYTQNFWLCWLTHTFIRTMMARFDEASLAAQRPSA